MRVRFQAGIIAIVLACVLSQAGSTGTFKVGYAERDITPSKPTPMWGYGARHDRLSEGVIDPLYAKGVVIDTSAEKIALVGLDLGRGPTEGGMKLIREAVKGRSGVGYLLISGSHTHHGPVIELKNEPGKGQGKFDDAVEYAERLNLILIDLINEAASKVQDARIGWGTAEVEMNRNRHTKIRPKVTDPEMAVVRFDDLSGKPIAMFVNFAAHPVILKAEDLRFSADYPGRMMNAVQEAMGAPCFFLQGAGGDMSPQKRNESDGIEEFGKDLAEEVIKIVKEIETAPPENPSIKAKDRSYEFDTRPDLMNPFAQRMLSSAFFPELVKAFTDELADNKIRPCMTTVLLNGELALVGASGEFFCNHSNRLKERSRAKATVFIGYCNGHHMYFPTIEAAAEGGYGADPTVSWVPLGSGEKMMNDALIDIYSFLGRFADEALRR